MVSRALRARARVCVLYPVRRKEEATVMFPPRNAWVVGNFKWNTEVGNYHKQIDTKIATKSSTGGGMMMIIFWYAEIDRSIVTVASSNRS